MTGFAGLEAFIALVIGAPALRGQAEEAVAIAGGRVTLRVDWPDLTAEIGRTAGNPVLCVEARGAGAEALMAALPRVDAVATALDLAIVAALDADQIDVVTANLLGPHVTLLVEPTTADWVGALAVAGQQDRATLTDGVREGEAARLRRLNEEVARIAAVLARLTGEGMGDDVTDLADRRRGYDGGPGAYASDGPIDAQWVRAAIRSRRMRDNFFGANLFEDPAWDMLLDLFAAELEGSQVSVSSLCIAAAVAPTTALRWITKLTEAGLFVREPDPFDRRRAFLALTERASAGMRGYVGAVRRAGLGIA